MLSLWILLCCRNTRKIRFSNLKDATGISGHGSYVNCYANCLKEFVSIRAVSPFALQ